MHPTGLLALPDHLGRVSTTGDPPEAMKQFVDFEQFRAVLGRARGYVDGSKGGVRRMTRWRCSRCCFWRRGTR